jgi:hypothetical protein
LALFLIFKTGEIYSMSAQIRVMIINDKIHMLVTPDDKLTLISNMTNRSNFNSWPMSKVKSILSELEIAIDLPNKADFVFPDDTEPLVSLSQEQIAEIIKKLFKFGEVELVLNVDPNISLSENIFPALNIKNIQPGTIKVMVGNTLCNLVADNSFVEPITPMLDAQKAAYDAALNEIHTKYKTLEQSVTEQVSRIVGDIDIMPAVFTTNNSGKIFLMPSVEGRHVYCFLYYGTAIKKVSRNGNVWVLKKPIANVPFRVEIKVRKSTNVPERPRAYRLDNNLPYITFHSSEDYVCMGDATTESILTPQDLVNLYNKILSVFETANISGMFGALSEKNQKELYNKVSNYSDSSIMDSELFVENNSGATLNF